MYSEHIVAELLNLVNGRITTGKALDAGLTRVVVEIGKIIGPQVGSRPSDIALTWWASQKGERVPVGTRAALHLLPDSRTALGLGAGRGVIETAGDRLVIVQFPEEGRYTAAYRLPGVAYGGLL